MSEFETPEFVADVGADGSVHVPRAYLEKLGYGNGTRVSVRVTELALSEAMRVRGITEAEVETIGMMQREAREDVLAFLMSEGALTDDPDAMERFGAWLRSDG